MIMELGPRLRAARKSRKISLRSLAKLTDFSPSFLSQVELGQSSPSLASLQRICDALDLDLPDLLRDPRPTRVVPVVRRADRRSLRSEWSKASAEFLHPGGGDERFSALLLSLEPNGRTGALPTRNGTRALAYCIRGKVHLTLGEEVHELMRGDSVVIEQVSASWENRSRARVEVIVISARFA